MQWHISKLRLFVSLSSSLHYILWMGFAGTSHFTYHLQSMNIGPPLCVRLSSDKQAVEK